MTEVRIDDLRRVGAGREAEIYAWGDGRVLRLARTPAFGDAFERERTALEAARGCGVPVPAVHDAVEVDGRPGLVLDRVDGHDLLSGMVLRPWELVLVPRILAELQSALHETRAPAELPDLRAEVARCLRSQLVPEDVRTPALRALDGLADDDRLCHGDFHPGNVLRHRGGYVLIDWKNATRGAPAADVARTRLLFVESWIPGWGPRPPQLLLAPLRWGLYLAYRGEYRRRRRVERGAVTSWVPVLAAARLSEDIPQERRRLLAIARRGLRRA